MPVERSSTMGPKQKKSTRKFERKHLGDALVRRKAAKVAAQRRRAKEMRLAAAMTEGAETGEADESDEEEEDEADESSDDEEFEGMEDEDVLAALASRAGAAGGTKGGGATPIRPTLPPKKRDAPEGDEDVVEDLVFSDDEDDEPKKSAKKAKKKKKRF